MRPTQSGKRMSQGLPGVRQAVHFAAILHGKSRMRKRARTDLRGGRSAMVVPTATVDILLARVVANFRVARQSGVAAKPHPQESAQDNRDQAEQNSHAKPETTNTERNQGFGDRVGQKAKQDREDS